ncbi:BON domain-containing protein [Paraburkholderia antibiotica]|uniref:BON domain-containing protein n=1 Tax=Paraburkholderia antibiotica TaxID=2728839 RepID=A0A7Y0A2N7_9BURK|nr:BON domain-containing protein [Paraburkholderia antibiotica]NML35392.1 BON domain-containing protein [Paraburkholderia antibiotica]
MNVQKLLKLAGATALVLGCLNAYAQPQAASNVTAQAAEGASPSTGDIKAANRQLVRDVRRAFRAAKSQGLRASNVTVRANNGAVTLTGSVTTAEQVDLATNIAKGVPGVQSVTTHVAVRKEFNGRGSN